MHVLVCMMLLVEAPLMATPACRVALGARLRVLCGAS
jgi:hypothetical protein